MSKKGVYRITAEAAERRVHKINPNVFMYYETYQGIRNKCKWREEGIIGDFWCEPGSLFNGLTSGNPIKANERRVKTCLALYGVENVFQDKDRVAGGMEQKYGVDNFWKRTDLLKNIYIDQLGVENPFQRKDLVEAGCMKKYGVKNSNMAKEVQDKAAKKSNNIESICHWKTGQMLLCRASYEQATVRFLNLQEIDFEWQPGPYTLIDGKTYRPDLFLIKSKIYVEIKGYKRPDAMLKWDMFLQQHPNSELWDRSVLINKGIIAK